MSNFLNNMRLLSLPSALLAVFLLTFACTPKTAEQTTATPVKPVPTVEWDTIGKPVIGAEEDSADHEHPEEEAPEDGAPEDEYVFMDEATVTPDSDMVRSDTLPPYNASHTFEHDLIHTKLELSFDWAKKRANGKATLTLRPWFYATDKLTLDAKNFDIHYVGFEGKKDTLKYEYDNEKLVINLGKTFTRTEEYKVTITYTAKPDERESFGGSAAITSDKGLYFINADGADPDKPRQIWTQGETESNSFWFPTVDKPNERCTQEMYLTVEDKYKTLSNGVLVSSKKNADGTRTDYWKMDKPHAPYLFMMAIGEYAVVKDKWRNIPLEYYVEPKFEQYARDIFPYTPEMLEFFSKKLGYDYPWPKYSQVVVRDYVSGAMENTSAVIFGEFMQQDKRGLLDNHLTNEKVVAHEMFHHWFGDLVTTESWANLTLNEGFANYSEYLWLEHKYGRDEADFHEYAERQGYIYSALDGGHPLINFGYDSRESMFDAHSYNKGGAILHMLRAQVGDEAFFAALNRYLKRNEFTDVEAHELRLAFEDVTGQDLNWFFNQWFYGSGHPNLDISYDWDETTGKASVTIAQTQEPNKETPYIYDLPLSVDIYDASGKARRESIRLTKRSQTFTFDAPVRPALINADADKALLAVKNDQHTPEEWAFMYRNAPKWQDRWDAFEKLKESKSGLAKAIFAEALRDKHWSLRQEALAVADLDNTEIRAAIAKLAETDPKPDVRATAIAMLSQTEDKTYVPIFEKGMSADQPYSVLGASLAALSRVSPEAALAVAKKIENDDNEGVVISIAELYAGSPEAGSFQWFLKKAKKVDNMAAFRYYELFVGYLTDLNDPAMLDQAVQAFQAVSLDSKNSLWRRFANTKAIADLRNFYRAADNTAKADELKKILADIREKETDETLKMYYGMFDQP
jgi:aminopeptidase N